MQPIRPKHHHWYRLASGAIYQLAAVETAFGAPVFKRVAAGPTDPVYWCGNGTTSGADSVFALVEEVLVTPAPKPTTLFVGVNLYKGGYDVKLGFHPGSTHLKTTREDVRLSLGAAGGSNSDWVGAGIMEVTVGDFAGVKSDG